VVLEIIKLDTATVPDAILDITVEALVPTFFAAYEVLE